MTLNELIYSLISLIRGDLKDDDYLDNRLIAHFIHTARATWVDKELGKPYPNLESFEQDLGAVLVHPVDSNVYNTISSGLNILQTVLNIPKPLYKRGLPLITKVGSLDSLELNFDYISKDRVATYGNSKFNTRTIGAYYANNKINLVSKNSAVIGGIEYINIKGIFINPTEVSGFTYIDGSKCYDANSPYPINEALIDYLHGDIMKYKLSALLDTPTDKKNDDNVNLQSNTTQTK